MITRLLCLSLFLMSNQEDNFEIIQRTYFYVLNFDNPG